MPDASGYYLVMKNGTRIITKDPYASNPDNQLFVTIESNTYKIGWPTQYYQTSYLDETLMIPNNGNGYVNSYFYTDLGINGGAKYELPFLGKHVTSVGSIRN
jgi:hypothetical protein